MVSERAKSARRLLDDRRERLVTLQRAVAAVGSGTLAASLQQVADALPPALSVDFANIRLLAPDRKLWLVAASGCTRTEIRKRAFEPLEIEQVRAMLASGAHDVAASSLGIRWVRVTWIETGAETIGGIGVGVRTLRQPSDEDVAVLDRVCEALAAKLERLDRSQETLMASALHLARRNAPHPAPVHGPIGELRRRERTILDLYADGLTTGEIAELLVISPHTVRTHVKLAMRRLGVRSRDEAATLVRADHMAQVV